MNRPHLSEVNSGGELLCFEGSATKVRCTALCFLNTTIGRPVKRLSATERDADRPGQVVHDWRQRHATYDGIANWLLHKQHGDITVKYIRKLS